MKQLTPLIAAGALVFAACSSDRVPTEAKPPLKTAARSEIAARRVGDPVGIEADFVDIADSAPGFAGGYVGVDGLTHVAATLEANRAAVLREIRRRYVGRSEEALLATLRQDTVRYNYHQLYSWKRALESRLGASGPIAFAVHVSTNTVDVFSQSAEADAATLAAAGSDGIPTDAVRLIRAGSASYLGLLTDEFTPAIPGGAGISDTSHGGCTLGINVKLYGSSTWDALTAAHCSNTIGGGADGTHYSQGGTWGTFVSGKEFGHEVADPAWMTSGCDAGYGHCRYADVSVIGYDSRTPDSGYVAVTIKLDSNTLEWVSKDSTSLLANGYWSDQPWEGVTLYHVGAKTGWHSGIVTEACADWGVGETGYGDYQWLCQTDVEGVADHGDSGGPVFSRDGGKDFLFAGLVSRFGEDTAHYVLSSFANICLDLGGCPTVQWW